MNITTNGIDHAAETIYEAAKKTPLEYSKRLSEQFGARIYLKREDMQDVRSFKIRGAYNKMRSLSASERRRGVVAASAGNHSQGVAYTCSKLRIKGVIFMPATTPNQKIGKVKDFGGSFVTVKLTGNTFDEAYAASQEYCKKHKAVYVHPFNDPLVIEGQGTVAKEIYEELDGNVDIVVSPEGGGGLISGIASYMKQKNPAITVYGAEPEGAASMIASLKSNKPTTLSGIDTFVDGAAVKMTGDLTFKIIKKFVSYIFPIPEGQVCTAMIDLYQKDGIIAEPAGALSVSALEIVNKKLPLKGKTVVCILSGGNNDLLRYPEIVERSLVWLGRKHYFIIEFAQKPGQLKMFLQKVLGPDDDIVLFEYMKKSNREKGPALVGLEIKHKSDLDPLLKRFDESGLSYQKINSSDMIYRYLI